MTMQPLTISAGSAISPWITTSWYHAAKSFSRGVIGDSAMFDLFAARAYDRGDESFYCMRIGFRVHLQPAFAHGLRGDRADRRDLDTAQTAGLRGLLQILYRGRAAEDDPVRLPVQGVGGGFHEVGRRDGP